MGLTLLANAFMPLNYNSYHKRYLCLSSIGHVFFSSHVKFYELQFPFFTISPSHDPIRCKLVFNLKNNVYGLINKDKACLVAKGFHQEKEFDYFEIVSPIGLPLQQIDINNVFLNYELYEEVFMTQHLGFLHKALYVLQQALGVITNNRHTTLIIIYANDIIITNDSTHAIQ
ncbi:hypothetical protein CR513_57078, partial [Mucuna pruriens]